MKTKTVTPKQPKPKYNATRIQRLLDAAAKKQETYWDALRAIETEIERDLEELDLGNDGEIGGYSADDIITRLNDLDAEEAADSKDGKAEGEANA